MKVIRKWLQSNLVATARAHKSQVRLSNGEMLEARLIVKLHDPVVRVARDDGKAATNERSRERKREKKEKEKVTTRGSNIHLSKNGERAKKEFERERERKEEE